jgi:hypothetical protein
LVLDAMGNEAPTLFVTLTAREYLTKGEELRRHLDVIARAVRRRWPRFEYFVKWELQERGALHAHLLVKGVPIDELADFRRVVVKRWCARVDAHPRGQRVEVCDSAVATSKYVAKKVLHAGKSNQETAFHWKHLSSQSKGYFARPMSEIRSEARASLAADARAWRAVQWAGHLTDGDQAIPSDLVDACHDVLTHRDEQRRGNWALTRREPSSARAHADRPVVDQATV